MTWFSRLPQQSQGVLMMLLSITVFATMDMLAKLLSTRVDVSQILWARYGGQLVVLTLFLAPRMPKLLRTDHPWLQLIRGLTQLTAAGCFFIALKTQGLAEATAVADLAPVLITLGAAVILREHVGPRRVFGIIAALIGALIIIRPGSAVFAPASLWPLGAAVSLAAYVLVTRYIGAKESPFTALLYSGLISTTLMSLIVPFHWVTPDRSAWILMGLIGCVGTLGQLAMIRAYMLSEASAIAPFSYFGLVVASGWGLLVFGTVPDLWTVTGALVIVLAGLYVWHRERQTQTS